jgi:hypothetical protein
LQPPIPGVEQTSKEEAMSTYARTVRELSLQLHIYRACQSDKQQQQGLASAGQGFSRAEESWRPKPLQKMKATLTQHLHWLMCLSLAGKVDMAMSL